MVIRRINFLDENRSQYILLVPFLNNKLDGSAGIGDQHRFMTGLLYYRRWPVPWSDTQQK